MRLNLAVAVAAVCVGLVLGAMLYPAVMERAAAETRLPADWQVVGTPRYQMFFGVGPAQSREAFLVDTLSGRTWALRLALPEGKYWWSAIENRSLGYVREE